MNTEKLVRPKLPQAYWDMMNAPKKEDTENIIRLCLYFYGSDDLGRSDEDKELISLAIEALGYERPNFTDDNRLVEFLGSDDNDDHIYRMMAGLRRES